MIPSHPAQAPLPTVSIGVPVYNAADSIGDALRTLLGQSWTDFELIVSDNASTDGTSEICASFAVADPRIRYFRQDSNIGAIGNFQYVLDAARARYFMWAASDDRWHQDFVARNVSVLEANRSIAASISSCTFDGKLIPPVFSGTTPLTGDFGAKIRAFSRSTHANARFYSVFRRELLTQGPRLSSFDFVAGDWSYMLELAKRGDFNLDQGIIGFHKAGGGAGSSSKRFHYEGKPVIEYLVPYLRFSRHLWGLVRSEPISTRLAAANCILRFNLSALIEQAAAWRGSR